LTTLALQSERRRHQRFRFSGPLEIRSLGSTDWSHVDAHDVSESGISFVAAFMLDRGEEVRVAGPPDPDAGFVVDVVVRQVTPGEHGFVIGCERR
jgi:hypothetical protein